MRMTRGLMHRIVCPPGVVWRVDRFVGPYVCIAEKIAWRNNDVTECRDIINGPEAVFRPLGVVRRFVVVSGEGRRGRDVMPTEMPFSVSVLRIHPGGVCLFHEWIPILWWAAGIDGDEGKSRWDGNQTTYTIFWSCSLRCRYFS